MLKFFRIPFADAGDRTAIPDAVDVNGFVSFEQGYGFDYQRQKTDPASKNIERDKMNSLFFDVTTAIAEIQAQGIPDFITSVLNGGTAYEYDVNAACRYLGDIYVSRKTANTSLPSVAADWFKVRLATPRAVAGGTADAITAYFVPNLGTLQDGDMIMIQHGAANATTTPTINPDGTGALSIYKGANVSLSAGDIPGAGFWGLYSWDATLTKLQMINPAQGVVSGFPTGVVFDHAGTAAPSGSLALPLVPTNVSRTTYAALFAVIGTTWGAGDGSTTFGLPYMPENYAGVQANGNVGTATVGSVIAHAHGLPMGSGSSTSGSYVGRDDSPEGAAVSTNSTGGSANLAAGVRFLKCIKL